MLDTVSFVTIIVTLVIKTIVSTQSRFFIVTLRDYLQKIFKKKTQNKNKFFSNLIQKTQIM